MYDKHAITNLEEVLKGSEYSAISFTIRVAIIHKRRSKIPGKIVYFNRFLKKGIFKFCYLQNLM